MPPSFFQLESEQAGHPYVQEHLTGPVGQWPPERDLKKQRHEKDPKIQKRKKLQLVQYFWDLVITLQLIKPWQRSLSPLSP